MYQIHARDVIGVVVDPDRLTPMTGQIPISLTAPLSMLVGSHRPKRACL